MRRAAGSTPAASTSLFVDGIWMNAEFSQQKGFPISPSPFGEEQVQLLQPWVPFTQSPFAGCPSDESTFISFGP